MNATARDLWLEANQRHLAGELGRLRARLLTALGETPPEPAPLPEVPEGFCCALDQVSEAFGLSRFERDVLLLAAGAELDSSIAALCARAQGLSGYAAPSFSLALACLVQPHWSALAPEAPLRRYRLVQPVGPELVTLAPLRVEERVLHRLAGLAGIDARLAPLVNAVAPRGPLTPAQRQAAERAAEWLAATREPAATLQVIGRSPAACEGIAASAATALGLGLYRIAAGDIPAEARERADMLALWRRDARLAGAALLVDASGADASPELVRNWVAGCAGVVFVAAREALGLDGSHRVEAPPADAESQFAAWHSVLGGVNGSEVHRLVAQFPSEPREILALDVAGAQASAWQVMRERRRRGLDGLAQRLDSRVGWEDLVLPPAELALLKRIATHVRHRDRVYREWGFAAKSLRGLGLSALFAGASGTGKTLAAEVLGNGLELDVYRIDLSAVVSKYIGETEKNLRRVFDAAEEAGAILLFDEADALFGKRSEVKDSHDRYANIEIAFLLTKMESYRGLSILTTNMKSALDDAFLRRIRFVVQFPFPAARERAEIWRRVFPPATPVEGLEFARLARMSLAGGNIRNVALAAAFRAAEEDSAVTRRHVLEAARGEYAKLERPITETELG